MATPTSRSCPTSLVAWRFAAGSRMKSTSCSERTGCGSTSASGAPSWALRMAASVLLCLVTLPAATPPLAAHASTASPVAHVDLPKLVDHIEQARKQWGVPGLVVTIVKDDELVMARGFGVRESGND